MNVGTGETGGVRAGKHLLADPRSTPAGDVDPFSGAHEGGTLGELGHAIEAQGKVFLALRDDNGGICGKRIGVDGRDEHRMRCGIYGRDFAERSRAQRRREQQMETKHAEATNMALSAAAVEAPNGQKVEKNPMAEASQAGKQTKTIKRTTPKVGRNDPCPCGSGKKYKKCHGAA